MIDGWDAAASRYDEMTKAPERRFMAPSRPWVGRRARGDVLEVAVGTGANLAHYAQDIRLTAIDWSSAMLRIAKDKASSTGREVDWHQGDVSDLPFADRSFDTVVSTFLLCSVVDVDRALQESLRVLRPGGRLLLVDHIGGYWPIRILQHLLNLITGPSQGEYWTRRPLRNLHRMGVPILEVERTTFGVIERVHALKQL